MCGAELVQVLKLVGDDSEVVCSKYLTNWVSSCRKADTTSGRVEGRTRHQVVCGPRVCLGRVLLALDLKDCADQFGEVEEWTRH